MHSVPTLPTTNLDAATAYKVAQRRSRILETGAAIIDRGSFFNASVQRTVKPKEVIRNTISSRPLRPVGKLPSTTHQRTPGRA